MSNHVCHSLGQALGLLAMKTFKPWQHLEAGERHHCALLQSISPGSESASRCTLGIRYMNTGVGSSTSVKLLKSISICKCNVFHCVSYINLFQNAFISFCLFRACLFSWALQSRTLSSSYQCLVFRTLNRRNLSPSWLELWLNEHSSLVPEWMDARICILQNSVGNKPER